MINSYEAVQWAFYRSYRRLRTKTQKSLKNCIRIPRIPLDCGLVAATQLVINICNYTYSVYIYNNKFYFLTDNTEQ